MGKAIPYDNRVKIISRLEAGEKTKSLSEELGYSESGIKKLWSRYKKEGAKAYENQYKNCGKRSMYDSKIRASIKEIRDNEQGSTYVRSKLLQKHPNMTIPSARTIQRWWVKEGTNREKGRPMDCEKKDGAKPLMKGGK